jgi:hypothetical protein
MGSGNGIGSGTGTGQQNIDTAATIVRGINDTAGVAGGGIGSTTGNRGDLVNRSATAGQGSDMDDQANLQPAKPAVELKLSGAYLEMRNKMEGLSGAAFDRQYVHQAQKDHHLSIHLLETYQKEGRNAQLRSWVKEQLPAIHKHKAESEKLSAAVGGKRSAKK